jgi:hypothetical protein
MTTPLWQLMHDAQERELADNPMADHSEAYGAMIHAVAAWLESTQSEWCDSDAEVVAELVADLRKEADR